MDDKLIYWVLLFIAGFFAGIINVFSGGGSAITLPALILLGLPPNIANGTNRIGILLQTVSAVVSFRGEGRSDVKKSLKYGLITIPGAVLGAVLSVKLDGDTFQLIIGIVMILILISMLIPNNKILSFEEEKNMQTPFWGGVLLFIAGFYGGFIQVGIGFILMAILQYSMKFSLTTTNMHKVFIVLVYTIPSLFVFIMSDSIDWMAALILSIATSFGAWISAKISVKKGDKFVKYFLILTILIMALKILKVF